MGSGGPGRDRAVVRGARSSPAGRSRPMTRVVIATSDWTSWPGFAGATWVPIQYVIGLLRLGVDVTWVDLLRCIDPRREPHSVEYLMERFEATARDFGFH